MSVGVIVLCEPRLRLQVIGRPKLSEATDDQGASLLLVDRQIDETADEIPAPFQFGRSLVALKPDFSKRQGKRIRKLRGTIPVRITAAEPKVLDIPLRSAANKEFATPELSFAFKRLQIEDGSRVDVVLDVQLYAAASAGDRQGKSLATKSAASLLDVASRICFLDERGIQYDGDMTIENVGDKTVRIRLLSGASSNATCPPRVLRLEEVVERDYEVPFEFSDVPIP
jgi:hypothetical protein